MKKREGYGKNMNTSSSPHSAGAAAADAGKYLPRDVLNAPQVKAAIEARSRTREDVEEVRLWLGSHFFRWVIGSFEHAAPIHGLADFRRVAGEAAQVPAWLQRRWQSEPAAAAAAGKPLPGKADAVGGASYYIDPEHPLLVDRERVLVEFLRARAGTRLEGKLQRITCFMAMELWEQEHKRMQKRRNKGWVPSSGLALREVLRTPNGIMFEFDGSHPAVREEMAYESYHMQHCLGQFARMDKFTGGYGEQYAEGVQGGRLRLFTLRSAGNQPHVTISLNLHHGRLSIDQIKGKQNRHPVRRYADDVLQFLHLLQLPGERNADCEGMGIVHEPRSLDLNAPAGHSGWKFITEVHDADFLLSAMNANFHLIEHFEHPPAALQWLLLRLAPHELGRVRDLDPAVAAAARLALPPEAWPEALQPPALTADNCTQNWHIEGQPISAVLCAPLKALTATVTGA